MMKVNRRSFLKLSTAALISACQKDKTGVSPDDIAYSVRIDSDQEVGHQILWRHSLGKGTLKNTDYLIVGGGLSGLSAATQLAGRNFVLCELSSQLGGTSSQQVFAGESFSQGAHYDLAYPANYGKEVLRLLEQLKIIRLDPTQGLWGFVDKKYLINENQAELIWTQKGFRHEMLPKGLPKTEFLELISQYQGHMRLPTRLIDSQFHNLNRITFRDFLIQSLHFHREFENLIDYQMHDDYGAGSRHVSALAGIHYYACRPYYNKKVELFSPPEGNYYFVQKLANELDPTKLKTQHLVRSIKSIQSGFRVEVADLSTGLLDVYKTQFIIYAGQKHSLSYVFQADAHLFTENIYAPWLVVNFILRNQLRTEAYWQNDMIFESDKPHKRKFMGFIDNAGQVQRNPNVRVLTAYYCFAPDQRQFLSQIKTHAANIVAKTIKQINTHLDQEITPLIQGVFLKVLGHAMPIPTVNYLFNDQNKYRSKSNLVYAGVDNGRLPLLFEAIDSGIQAVKLLD